MPVQTTDHAEDIERERWRHLRRIARQLATEHTRTAIVVRHAGRWLEHISRQVGDHEIVVTWTVADAHLLRHQLQAHLPEDRVFAAAPRVRYRSAQATDEIPPPRRPHQQADEEDSEQETDD